MTPSQFRDARQQLGLSKSALSRVLGLAEGTGTNGRTVRRWECGAVPVPGPVALAMRAIVWFGLPSTWAETQKAPPPG